MQTKLHLYKSRLDNSNNILLLLIPAIVFFLTLIFSVMYLRSTPGSINQDVVQNRN